MPVAGMAVLEAGLRRLDLLIHREILRLRARYQLSLDEFRGLYISDGQVDELVSRLERVPDGDTAAALTQQAAALADALRAFPEDGSWHRLTEVFGLTRVEQDVLLIGLAPEIDPKYETLFAYLHNDVTRKLPTPELAARLLADGPEEAVLIRGLFQADGPLVRGGVLELVTTPGRESARLARAFRVVPAVADWLLGLPYCDERLHSVASVWDEPVAFDDVAAPPSVRDALAGAAGAFKRGWPDPPALVLLGQRGAERRYAARALHTALARPTLCVDLEAAARAPQGLRSVVAAALLQQRLCGMGLYLGRGDGLFDADGRPVADAAGALDGLDEASGSVVCALPPAARWRDVLGRVRAMVLTVPRLDARERRAVWLRRLGADAERLEGALPALIDRFALGPAQIRAAVSSARDACRVDGNRLLDVDALLAAARAQSDQTLGGLAARVPTLFTWNDLVLPVLARRRLEDVVNAVAHRPTVLGDWGFERRLPGSRGIKVLFAGASGTGKTMAAGVIARALGLDLRRIDLASVVSKYIGETEKNLDRVFRAAQEANVVLFFDEADALFGKRSEVKDAHDRYANIEVAYLLQKVEDHDGVVILATNLSRNIDEAFSRRMDFVIEFPMPDAVQRERIWRQMMPPEAPLAADVDLPFLARQFELAGGDIRNVVLDAAYAAATASAPIGMRHLLQALVHQLGKQGRAASAAAFKQYWPLVCGVSEPSSAFHEARPSPRGSPPYAAAGLDPRLGTVDGS